MLSLLFKNPDSLPGIYVAGAAILTFIATFILTSKLKEKLPHDIGRAYAVNAEKSKGKPRGAGIIFVTCFSLIAFIFAPFSLENSIYLICLMLAMLTGFLDDASKIPWNDYKKGLLDLLIAVGVALTFALNNPTTVCLRLLSSFCKDAIVLDIPIAVYVILATILIWMSINVINCTDGVDGLCTTLSGISLFTFLVITNDSGTAVYEILFVAALIAYLWFNASPSILLMGDAGSRTIGVFMALAAMKCGDPFLFIPVCIVFIVDGGIGLVKVFLKRFLKISILKNTRTPLHDHARKNKGWSDTHIVIRFCIIQFLACIIVISLVLFS